MILEMIRQLAYSYALTDKLQEFCVELVLVQPKPSIISSACLNQCFIYDKGSYIILAFFLFRKTSFGL